jgi:hypothetical protein
VKYCPDDGLFRPKHVGNNINTSYLIKYCAFVGVMSLFINRKIQFWLLEGQVVAVLFVLECELHSRTFFISHSVCA